MWMHRTPFFASPPRRLQPPRIIRKEILSVSPLCLTIVWLSFFFLFCRFCCCHNWFTCVRLHRGCRLLQLKSMMYTPITIITCIVMGTKWCLVEGNYFCFNIWTSQKICSRFLMSLIHHLVGKFWIQKKRAKNICLLW